MKLGKYMTRSALVLALSALAGTGLVATIYQGTKARVAEAERQHMLHSLNAVIPPARYDNDIFHDVIEVTDPEWLGTSKPVQVFRARRQGQPVAVALLPTAPDGYAGNIHLLVAINVDGSVAGVRVIAHQETPGLGDGIDERHSDWILGFNGRSLTDPEQKGWHVQRDGGVFDQFTGATITPRAVVKAVFKALSYFKRHKDELFSQPSIPQEETIHE